MNNFDDIPEWRLEQIYQDMVKKRQATRAKKLGRPVTTWGGKRAGAGRPKILKQKTTLDLELNPIQVKILAEMGEGSIEQGILKLINENM
jgi:hypothetical protein